MCTCRCGVIANNTENQSTRLANQASCPGVSPHKNRCNHPGHQAWFLSSNSNGPRVHVSSHPVHALTSGGRRCRRAGVQGTAARWPGGSLAGNVDAACRSRRAASAALRAQGHAAAQPQDAAAHRKRFFGAALRAARDTAAGVGTGNASAQLDVEQEGEGCVSRSAARDALSVHVQAARQEGAPSCQNVDTVPEVLS